MTRMPVNLSVKNVPDALAAKLRSRAAAYEARAAATPADGLLERLLAIAGSRGIDTTKRLTREQAHDRKLLRKSTSTRAR
jgi:plasmid stability protein